MKHEFRGLHVLTDQAIAEKKGESMVSLVQQAIDGGANVIQLRDKKASLFHTIKLGRQLRKITRENDVTFIVNDRVFAALVIGADGVHVGQQDMNARRARRLIGSKKILGVSVSTPEEALEAEKAGADYLGVGPVFKTQTKDDSGKPIGLDGLTKVAKAVNIPIIAIGSVNPANAEKVIRAGADGVAVISSVMAAKDVSHTTRKLRTIVDFNKMFLKGPR